MPYITEERVHHEGREYSGRVSRPCPTSKHGLSHLTTITTASRFTNTRGRYVILQCTECKQEFVYEEVVHGNTIK